MSLQYKQACKPQTSGPEATLVRNYDPASYSLTGARCRATNVAKNSCRQLLPLVILLSRYRIILPVASCHLLSASHCRDGVSLLHSASSSKTMHQRSCVQDNAQEKLCMWTTEAIHVMRCECSKFLPSDTLVRVELNMVIIYTKCNPHLGVGDKSFISITINFR